MEFYNTLKIPSFPAGESSLGIKGWFLRTALAALGLFLLFYRSSTRITVPASIVAVVLANEICDLAKWLHFAPRPAAILDDVRVLGNLLTSSGTFSAHSVNMAAVAFVFWWRLGWKWGLPWALVAFLTGLPRVYVGAHFPSQVMLGWLAGALCGVLVAGSLAESLGHVRRRSLRARASEIPSSPTAVLSPLSSHRSVAP